MLDKLNKEYLDKYSDKDIREEEAYKRLIMKINTNVKLSSVILSDENREKIDNFLKEQAVINKILYYGLPPMNRIIMYGDSGCGKTFLTTALSNHLGYTMLYVNISDAISNGEVTRNMSDIFELANKYKKCMIFLDECDSIAWNRDSSSPDKSDMRRATNSLFQLMDQMEPTNVIVAATNMYHRLDPAFKRRFNMKMNFLRPSGGFNSLLDRFLFKDKGFTLTRDVDESIKRILDRRLDISYYQIQGIVERAMKQSVMNGTLEVKESDIYEIAKQEVDFQEK